MTPRSTAQVVLAVAVVVIAILLISSGGPGYQVKVDLPDASGARPGSRVEVGGVTVGSVSSLQITPSDHALATLSIDGKDAPIGSGASVVIRPANLLGEMYVDLSVGNRAHPQPSGTTIPSNRTRAAVELDQVLDVLEPTVRDRLAILIHEAGVALFGRGTDVAELLSALPPSIGDTQQLIDQVDQSNATLAALLDHAGRVLATFAANRQKLGDLVDTASQALVATADRRPQLSATIAAAPSTLAQLQATLQRLDTAGAALRPAAAGLRESAPSLTQTLDALPGFTAAALPALATVRSVSPRITALGREFAPVVSRLRPTATSLAGLAGDSSQLLGALDQSTANLLGTLQNWARALQDRDGLSHEFRVSIEVTPGEIESLLPFIESGAATGRRRSPPAPAQPAATPRVPAAPGSAGASGSGSTASPGKPVISSGPKGVTIQLPSLPAVDVPVPQIPIVKHLLSFLLGR